MAWYKHMSGRSRPLISGGGDFLSDASSMATRTQFKIASSVATFSYIFRAESTGGPLGGSMDDSRERPRRWSKAQNRFAWPTTVATVGWLAYVLLTSRLFS